MDRNSVDGKGVDSTAGQFGAALMRAAFTQAGIGLYVLDPELRPIRSHDLEPGPPGTPPLEWETPGLGGSVEVTGLLRDVLRTGEPVLDHTPEVAPAPGRVLSISALRLDDPAGEPVGVMIAVRDTTVRHHAVARLDLLRRAGRRIGTTLDVFRTAQELADAAVPAFGGGAAVDILDSVVHGEAPPPGPVVDVAVRRAGFAWAEGGLPEGHWPLGAVRVMRFGTPFAQAMADVRPRLVRELHSDDPWLERDPARARMLASVGAHSLLAVPMSARGVVLGLAAFYRCRGEPAFDDGDLAVAAELVDRAALCVDNARRYTREHTLAGLLQRTLVPVRLPASSAVRTAHTYLPVASGGTWYDVLRLSGARVALVVGHVAGSGLAAVTTMGQLRTALTALAALDMEPGELLGRLHDLTVQLGNEQVEREESEWLGSVSGSGGPGEEAPPVSATCLLAVYDPVSGQCTVASAGHPPPVLVPPGEPARTVAVDAGPSLGMGEGDYRAVVVDVPPESVLALHSGALSTAVSDAGLARAIGDAVGSVEALQEACDNAVSAVLPDERPDSDDVLLLLARTRTLGPDRVASWTLPPVPESAAAARRLVSGQLSAWGLGELVAGTELVASELVTNAVRYSEGVIGLRLIREEGLICEVSDGSSAAPHQRRAADDDEGGRGLFLVGHLSRHWGIRHEAQGKTVWAEQPLP